MSCAPPIFYFSGTKYLRYPPPQRGSVFVKEIGYFWTPSPLWSAFTRRQRSSVSRTPNPWKRGTPEPIQACKPFFFRVFLVVPPPSISSFFPDCRFFGFPLSEFLRLLLPPGLRFASCLCHLLLFSAPIVLCYIRLPNSAQLHVILRVCTIFFFSRPPLAITPSSSSPCQFAHNDLLFR